MQSRKPQVLLYENPRNFTSRLMQENNDRKMVQNILELKSTINNKTPISFLKRRANRQG